MAKEGFAASEAAFTEEDMLKLLPAEELARVNDIGKTLAEFEEDIFDIDEKMDEVTSLLDTGAAVDAEHKHSAPGAITLTVLSLLFSCNLFSSLITSSLLLLPLLSSYNRF